MSDDVATLKAMYDSFNKRDIDGVLGSLDKDVAWANGMDGGHEQGHAAVRAYWTRQWAKVRPLVEPLSFHGDRDGKIRVEVRQTIRDLDGNDIDSQDGLKSRVVHHVFHFRGGKVKRFDVAEEVQQD